MHQKIRIMNRILLITFLLLLNAPHFATAKNSRNASLMAQVDDSGITQGNTASQIQSHVTDSLAASDAVYNAYDEYVKRKVIKSPEFILSMALLIFAAIICLAEIAIFLKGHMDADHMTKLIILTLIIFSVLFLIVLGYTNDQIGPALGLLGTIAGYLLGKSQKVADTPQPKASKEHVEQQKNNP
jgi:hypothetical protein